MKRLFLVLAAFSLWSCANTNCRKLEEQQGLTRPPIQKELDPMAKTSAADRVFVYKPDGSLQCNQGQAISLNDMKKQLGKITIYSSAKRHDGQMRIQVCGHPTGNSNVYEIDRSSLEEAIKAGFFEWTFN